MDFDINQDTHNRLVAGVDASYIRFVRQRESPTIGDYGDSVSLIDP